MSPLLADQSPTISYEHISMRMKKMSTIKEYPENEDDNYGDELSE